MGHITCEVAEGMLNIWMHLGRGKTVSAGLRHSHSIVYGDLINETVCHEDSSVVLCIAPLFFRILVDLILFSFGIFETLVNLSRIIRGNSM